MMSSIYFLIKNKTIIYIGKSCNIKKRVYEHTDKNYDYVKYINVYAPFANKYEKRLINYFSPVHNVMYSSDDKKILNRCKLKTLSKKNRLEYTVPGRRGTKGVHPLYDKLTSMEVGEQFNTIFIHSHQTYAHGRARAMNKKFRTFRVNGVLTVIRIS